MKTLLQTFRLGRILGSCFGVVLCGVALGAEDRRQVTPLPTPEERQRLLMHKSHVRVAVPDKSVAAATAQDDFDATHYFLDLDFNDSVDVISGTVRMTATSLASPLERVVLDLNNSMSVLQVTCDGIPQTFTHNAGLLEIDLDTSIQHSRSFEISVTFTGTPVSGSLGWNRYYNGSGSMVWSLSEPTGARTWWPCKDRPDDKALVEAWWTVRPEWIATGNGLLQGVDTLPGGRKRYRWKATNPLTTYLVSVAAANFATFSDTYTAIDGSTVPIDYYVYPEDLEDAQLSFSEMPAMMEFFADLFGEYPFVDDKYGMTAFPFGGAMEHSTNTSYGYFLIDGGHRYDFIIVHELVHQWFGDSVSPETWPDIWLNEGFASFGEALWFEHIGGPQAYRDYMQGMYSSSFSGTLYDPGQLFGTTVYNKGAWVQHMLRGVMGETAFFDAQRDWYVGRKDGVGNTADYQAVAESRYGTSLDFFFQQWVYGEGRPRYLFGVSTAEPGDGRYVHYVRIRQDQSGLGTFTMPIDLTLMTTAGEERRTVWNDTDDQYFVLETAAPLTELLFDDENWVLKTSADPIELVDDDGDGVPDVVDNCAQTANPAQLDTDLDSSGDLCDADDDNDLIPDPGDCAPLDPLQGAPGEVSVLNVDGAAGLTTALTWTGAFQADTYEVVRGTLRGLSSGYGGCLATGILALESTDPDLPPAGEGFLYLVRGRDVGCGGAGSLGVDSTESPRTANCP